MGWLGTNRRQFPRVVYPCLVKIGVKSQAQDPYLTHTENISVGGICVTVKKEMPLGTPLEIEIDLLQDSDNIITYGRVAWVGKRKASEAVKATLFDIGVQFENLTDKDKHLLQAAIEKFIKKGHKVLKPTY